MARVLSEGFEMKDLVGWVTTGNTAIDTTTKRSGNASLFVGSVGGAYYYAYYTLPSDLSEGYIRMGIYMSGTYSIIYMSWYHDATLLGSLRFQSNEPMKLYNSAGGTLATGSVNLLPSLWNLIELHIKIADAGNLDVRIDESTDASLSYAGDTKPGADTTFNRIRFDSGNGQDLYVDDIAVNDTTGGVDDSWPGEGKIIMMYPNDDVTTELTQFPALTDHHADVDDFPADGDTTYVQGTVVDEEDLYELTASGLVAADVDSISRVWVESRTKDTVSAAGEVALFIVSNATEGTGADVVLTTSYTKKILSQEFLQDPDGPAAWSVAALDALQGGVRTRA